MSKSYALVVSTAAAVVASSIFAPRAQAANENTPMMVYLGYYALYQQYGGNLANGSNVSIALDEANGYPTLADGRFTDKTLTRTYTGTAVSDSHATTVGARFFGNDTGYSQRSVAPKLGAAAGGNSVQLYKYSEFTGAYLLSPGSIAPYGSQNNARVASHAYNYSDTTIGFATRMDYLAQRDDFLQVVPNNDYGAMGNQFNSIVVVSNDGATAKTAAVGTGTPYVAGRVSPTITGPLTGSPSDAIGQVAGVVGLLVSKGKTTTSNITYTTAATTAVTAPYTGSNFSTYAKAGYSVTSGDSSEVVKAALMAGANRIAAADSTLGIGGISNYRATAANQSTNGLDYRWGAGMVNAQNSYEIVNAGEKNSLQDGVGTGQSIAGGIGTRGFDYDQSFGGSGSNAAATYGFTAGASGKFYATLAWNVKIAGATTPSANFDSTATLYDLDLTLTDLTAGTITALSASTIDNTENLWTDLIAGHVYSMDVTTKSAAFDWDYGLAWRSDVALTPTLVPEPAALSIIGLGAATMLRRRRTSTSCLPA